MAPLMALTSMLMSGASLSLHSCIFLSEKWEGGREREEEGGVREERKSKK
jgi:hypothetical protein